MNVRAQYGFEEGTQPAFKAGGLVGIEVGFEEG
jgi:hypothetical protein